MLSPLKRHAKTVIKRSLQHCAARYGRHTRASGRPQLAVLMYHRILPADDPRARLEEPGMMVTPETFRMHMQTLHDDFHVMPLSRWLHDKRKGVDLPARCCAITFDDGWLDNYEFAFPVLQEYKLPATIFLVSDMIGSQQHFWPQRLAMLLDAVARQCPERWRDDELKWLREHSPVERPDALDGEAISHIIARVKTLSDRAIHDRISTLAERFDLDLPATPALLDWQQVRTMHDSGLVEMGSHTRHHVRLDDTVDTALLHDEITESRQQIESRLGQTVSSFCYPNGDFCPRALAEVAHHYDCAVTTQHGWNDDRTDPYRLNRIALHEDISADRTAFLARLSGWL